MGGSGRRSRPVAADGHRAHVLDVANHGDKILSTMTVT